MHYWDELRGRPGLSLAQAVEANGDALALNGAGDVMPGSYLQIDSEVMRVDSVEQNGTRYVVTRGMHSSQPAEHGAQSVIYALQN
jgi:hypothetical protein